MRTETYIVTLRWKGRSNHLEHWAWREGEFVSVVLLPDGKRLTYEELREAAIALAKTNLSSEPGLKARGVEAVLLRHVPPGHSAQGGLTRRATR